MRPGGGGDCGDGVGGLAGDLADAGADELVDDLACDRAGDEAGDRGGVEVFLLRRLATWGLRVRVQGLCRAVPRLGASGYGNRGPGVNGEEPGRFINGLSLLPRGLCPSGHRRARHRGPSPDRPTGRTLRRGSSYAVRATGGDA
jgi:hypothetical protein